VTSPAYDAYRRAAAKPIDPRPPEAEIIGAQLELAATDLYDVAHALLSVRHTISPHDGWWSKLEETLTKYREARKEWKKVGR